MTKSSSAIAAGLDIGSSKVSVSIGVVSPQSAQITGHGSGQASAGPAAPMHVLGVGTALNHGIRQGIVVNIDATTEAIRKAREEAELMSGYKVHEVWVSVSGAHIKSFDSRGMVAIKNKEVTTQDIDRVIEAAKAVAVPLDRLVLHVIPREYKVDEQEGILDPRGMSGVRLEASVHIVTASHTAVTNNLKCIERAGLQSLGLVLDQLASSLAVLSEDEKKLGVVLVDMGADSCHLIYFIHGSVAKTSNIPVGGHHLTHDIAIGLRTPQIAAESLKRKYGSAMLSLVREDESIEVEGVGGRNARMVRRRDLAEVIEPRVEEILLMIQKDIETSGLKHLLGSGVVLTGGTSELRGLTEMAEFFFDLPVRKGSPDHIGGLKEVVRSGDFATSAGLLLYAHQQKKYARAYSLQSLDFSESSAKPVVSGLRARLKRLWQDLF